MSKAATAVYINLYGSIRSGCAEGVTGCKETLNKDDSPAVPEDQHGYL